MDEAKLNELKRKHNLTEEEISKKVRERTREVTPKIGEARKRTSSKEVFRTKILQALSEGDKTQFKRFSDITAGEPKENIGRFLMAALTLATAYKIEIKNETNNELETDGLEMRLFDPKLASKPKEDEKENDDENNVEDEDEEEKDDEDVDELEDDQEDEQDDDQEDDQDDDDDELNGDSVNDAKKECEPKADDNMTGASGDDLTQQF